MREAMRLKMKGNVITKILETSIHKIHVEAIDERTDKPVELTLFLDNQGEEEVKPAYIIAVLHQLGFRFNRYIESGDSTVISQNCETLFEVGKAKELE